MQAKWIDLGDADGRLKLGQIQGGLYLFITGLPNNSIRWSRSVQELGFKPGQNNKYLVRRIADGESPRASTYRAIFPSARITMMEREDFYLDFARGRKEGRNTEEDRQAEIDLTHYVRLGRNSNGDEVLSGAMGRVIRDANDRVIRESDGTLKASMFLRASNEEDVRLCADGFVRSMDKGEVQYSEDVDRFVEALYGESSVGNVQVYGVLRSHIEAAMLRHVSLAHDTAQDAYADAARLYDYLPPYVGQPRGLGSMPLPLSVISQRLLGDMDGKQVIIPNAFDGSSYAFLPDTSRVNAYRGGRDLSGVALSRDNVTWSEAFDPAREGGADALFFNADPELDARGERVDYRDAARFIRALAPGARAVLTLAGDDPQRPGVVSSKSEAFLRMLASKYEIEDAFEVGHELTQRAGTGHPLRVISLRNVAPISDKPLSGLESFPSHLPVLHGWDEIKERVDETLVRADVREASSDEVDVRRLEMQGSIQRPYLSFSKVGQARTMTPANLQGPIQSALSDVESRYGSVDSFVSRELGFQELTLAERLSPEQVDAIALSISRIRMGRANILGDETGIGKGRTLASLAVWANKQGKDVVFITDRANLFSDFFGGDLGDLDERGRFRPLIMNSGEAIVDKNAPVDPPPVLVPASRPEDMRRILDGNQTLSEIGANIVFATYSQINGEESEKATWLKNQLSNALLIVDEAHIAAGANSNVGAQILSMTELAWAVQYSSATWAKSSRNLQIYARAFPESINVSTLANTMNVGGEAFAEVFSSMLARDGALTRREHDLSRLETVVEIDDAGRDASIRVSDAVATAMNAIAMISGDIDRMMLRANQETINHLKAARGVRSAAFKVNLFAGSFGAGSVLYQVNRRMLAALNAQHVARIALKSIDDGLRPIIIFDDTGEALTNQLIDQAAQVLPDGTLLRPEFIKPPTIRDLMRKVTERLSRVRVTEKDGGELLAIIEAREAREARQRARDAGEVVDAVDADQPPDVPGNEGVLDAADGGLVERVRDDDAADLDGAIAALGAAPDAGTRGKKSGPKFITVDEMPNISEEDKQTYMRGVEEINRLIDALPDIPLNAPDIVHDMLRKSGVTTGEISGRSFMLSAQGDDGLSRIVQRSKKKSAVTASVRAFQNGVIQAILINRAAATGIGLHAQPRFADPRKRNMIWLQAPENPTDVTQLAGRGNRYDQVTAPRMTFAATGLYGELRQIMRNNKKQVIMACNVRSSREASVKFDTVPDLMNPVGRDVIREVFQDNPGYAHRTGVSAYELENPAADPVGWLNKVTLLLHPDQEKVYQDIYAAFDEALLRHDLAGTNPLRSKEMDVSAEMLEKTLFQGVETDGVGSAFDGPVYAQRIRWKERLAPLGWSQVLDKIKESREALVRGKRAQLVGEGGAGMPSVEYTTLRENTLKQMDALVRIAVASDSTYENLAQALLHASPSHPIRRAHSRQHWVEENLAQIMPGFTISVQDFANPGLQTQGIIVAVDAPPVGKEHQFGRWKIQVVTPGDRHPVSYTLSSLMNASFAESRQVRDGIAQTVLGRDLFDGAPGARMAQALARRFDMTPTGDRVRHATVLTGNMYLASEWANASSMGHGVIFTDDRKVRHRGVILSQDVSPEMLQHMPVRLWSPEMIRTFFERCLSEENEARFIDGVTVDRKFSSAWAYARGIPGRNMAMTIRNGVGISMGVNKDGLKRQALQLRQCQERLRGIDPETGKRMLAAQDPLHCVVKTVGGKSETPVIQILADTPEKMGRAIDILIEGSGLEVYAQAHSEAGQIASEVLVEFFARRRDGAALQQGLLVRQAEEVVPQDHGVVRMVA